MALQRLEDKGYVPEVQSEEQSLEHSCEHSRRGEDKQSPGDPGYEEHLPGVATAIAIAVISYVLRKRK